jgi:NRPS condensation-like uncharacterized protein
MDYEAQAFDLMQLFYDETGFNDHQMHCCVELEGAVDEQRLERAMGLCLEAVPILATRFVRDKGGYRWTSLAPEALGPAFAAAPDRAAFELERTCRIDERVGPQVRLAWLGGGRPRLAFTMNHMVSDAAGFKDFLYLFCETYRSIGRDESFRPGRLIDGDRGLRPVLARTGKVARALALLGRGGRNNRAGETTFPFEGGPGEERPFIATRTIGRERTAELKTYCKERGATVNDAALAAYFRALSYAFKEAGMPARDIELPVMVDMRRYLPDRDFRSLRNLTSTVLVRARDSGGGFERTLLETKAGMDALKDRGIGLGGFVKLDLLFSSLGQVEAARRLRGGLRNPRICMTNIGEIDSSRLAFDGARVGSVYICGAIKHKPHFQVAVSGFDGTLTLSSNLYGTAADRAQVEAFLASVEKELVAR